MKSSKILVTILRILKISLATFCMIFDNLVTLSPNKPYRHMVYIMLHTYVTEDQKVGNIKENYVLPMAICCLQKQIFTAILWR